MAGSSGPSPSPTDAEAGSAGGGDAPAGYMPGGVTGKGFVKGRSGNPDGRRRGTRSVTARLRDLLDQPTPDGKQVADLLARRILTDALKGDHRMIRELLDRTEGRPAPANPDADAAPDEAPKRIVIPGADGSP